MIPIAHDTAYSLTAALTFIAGFMCLYYALQWSKPELFFIASLLVWVGLSIAVMIDIQHMEKRIKESIMKELMEMMKDEEV